MGFFDFFPYTNFHNVNLDWVLQRVKEWGELVEANNIAFHNLEEANASFKHYVETYLENLDVQAQIDDKLDRMFESGELTEYLQPYVSNAVTDWLDEHITEPTGVVIDNSLTVEGACADANATGEGIRGNTALINDTRNTLSNFIDSGAGFTNEAKEALLECFKNVAWINGNGLSYLYDLRNKLYNTIDWLFSWSYTDGMPTDVGMIEGVNGESVAGITSNGLLMIAENATAKSIQYYTNVDSTIVYSYGVFEFTFIVNAWGSYNTAPYGNGVRVYLGMGRRDENPLKCPELTFNQSGILHLQADNDSYHWVVVYNTPFTTNTEYKIRCEESLTETKIYINDIYTCSIDANLNYEIVTGQTFMAYRGVNVTFKNFKFNLT